ncbi:hypothetical protein DMA15_03740 [Streptomyces sp. WAC 01529]|uniref:hypothetical protein n=1 Tax=Streptomyces sp. WAC 01529 TaxID=2203205 RepID=UPI000F6E4BCB|nr:hypothetical protein [Streptomyces sp. WAC 01529]AZM51806.1 hypothetical protein DMA15_03740 [Streptomyces sp. WAC 01529]
MPINTDLLIKIRDKIREHPEQHDQAHWARRTSCGTTYCIAGWAAVLSGARLDWSDHWTDQYEGGARADTVNSGAETIDDYAQRVLGLDNEQCALFDTDNGGALTRLDELIVEGGAAA